MGNGSPFPCRWGAVHTCSACIPMVPSWCKSLASIAWMHNLHGVRMENGLYLPRIGRMRICVKTLTQLEYLGHQPRWPQSDAVNKGQSAGWRSPHGKRWSRVFSLRSSYQGTIVGTAAGKTCAARVPYMDHCLSGYYPFKIKFKGV